LRLYLPESRRVCSFCGARKYTRGKELVAIGLIVASNNT
jgi:hypothetical protein